ncbi:hypothetical protein [Actinomycetospora atypica]|uniref:Uncharacterized protein n=1 Tax=Actinomycetospora atypica TaxID=1290095 RepID=A0ABV9YJN7_9PSEU
MCVQIAEKPSYRPGVGWVTTTSRAWNTFPPPTGTSEIAPTTVPAAPDPALGAMVNG